MAKALLLLLRQRLLLGLECPAALQRSLEMVHLPYTHPIMQTRGRDVEERQIELHVGPDAPASEQESQPKGPPPAGKAPAHSFLQLRYPFRSQPTLKQHYTLQGPHGPAHNVALWLEDMDTFAADVGGRHCDVHKRDKQQVTAFLEDFVWLEHECPHLVDDSPLASAGPASLAQPHDMRLSGQVTWVGKSSMEVTLELWAHPAPLAAATAANGHSNGTSATTTTTSGEIVPASASVAHAVAVARFVMAARSLDLKHAAAVAPLQLAGGVGGGVEEARFELGLKGHLARQDRRAREKAKHPPDAAEAELLTRLIGGHRHRPHGHPPSSQGRTQASSALATLSLSDPSTQPVPMASTKLHHVSVTSERDVNTSGSTFGGHLLRLGYEHAARVAAAHCGGPCHLLTMSEVAFLALVPIGTELHLEGHVAYAEGDVVRVHVTAFFYDPKHVHANGHHHHHGNQNHHDNHVHSHDKHHLPGHPVKTVAETFWCAFSACKASGEGGGDVGGVRQVAPDTPEEVERFLHALRQHKRDVGKAPQ